MLTFNSNWSYEFKYASTFKRENKLIHYYLRNVIREGIRELLLFKSLTLYYISFNSVGTFFFLDHVYVVNVDLFEGQLFTPSIDLVVICANKFYYKLIPRQCSN